MKPPEARIGFIDDHPLASVMIPKTIEKMGSTLVSQAATKDEADDLVDRIEETGINVLLVDDNLDVAHAGYDIVKRVREEHPDVNILSISSSSSMGDAMGIPTLPSSGMNAEELIVAIEPF